jgi:hypothetical protein
MFWMSGRELVMSAFLAAELVGFAGRVVGIDRSSAALALARARAEEKCDGELAAMAFDQLFDAAIGRYVPLFPARSSHIAPRNLAARAPRWNHFVP